MNHNKIIDVIGIILLFIGFFLALLPHALHTKAGLEEASHLKHVISGIALVIASLAILIYNNNALATNNKRFKLRK